MHSERQNCWKGSVMNRSLLLAPLIFAFYCERHWKADAPTCTKQPTHLKDFLTFVVLRWRLAVALNFRFHSMGGARLSIAGERRSCTGFQRYWKEILRIQRGRHCTTITSIYATRWSFRSLELRVNRWMHESTIEERRRDITRCESSATGSINAFFTTRRLTRNLGFEESQFRNRFMSSSFSFCVIDRKAIKRKIVRRRRFGQSGSSLWKFLFELNYETSRPGISRQRGVLREE